MFALSIGSRCRITELITHQIKIKDLINDDQYQFSFDIQISIN